VSTKCAKNDPFKSDQNIRFIEGRTRVETYSTSPVNLPDMKQNKNKKKTKKNNRGENESTIIILLPCESPRQLNISKNKNKKQNSGSERGERELLIYSPLLCNLPDN